MKKQLMTKKAMSVLFMTRLFELEVGMTRGKLLPYWPTLWNYLEQHQYRAARRERLRLLAREWQVRKGLARLVGLADWSMLLSGSSFLGVGSVERRYLRWSRAVAMVQAVVSAVTLGVVAESLWWKTSHELPLEAIWTRWAYALGRQIPMPELRTMPSGSSQIGSQNRKQNELPIRTVVFEAPFNLGKTEVTFQQYDAFAVATGRRLPNDSGFGRGNRPAINVDFSDVLAYINWLSAMTGESCRLPSEAEWEYACRAGATSAYNVGDHLTEEHANVGNSVGETSEVGTYPANAWDLNDMHGNVFEWTLDCWHENYEGATEEGEAWREREFGDCTLRVLRGGSWFSVKDDARCAARSNSYPSSRNNVVGFRILCSSSADASP